MTSGFFDQYMARPPRLRNNAAIIRSSTRIIKISLNHLHVHRQFLNPGINDTAKQSPTRCCSCNRQKRACNKWVGRRLNRTGRQDLCHSTSWCGGARHHAPWATCQCIKGLSKSLRWECIRVRKTRNNAMMPKCRILIDFIIHVFIFPSLHEACDLLFHAMLED